MKKTTRTITALLLAVLMLLSITACTSSSNSDVQTEAPTISWEDIFWQDAEYTEDTALGDGEKTFEFQVIVGENSVTFTVSTDEDNLGEALQDNKLIAGEESEYGLYVKEVNGITADYDENGYYWSFTKDGEMMMTGVDGETVEADAHYEMTCTK